MNQELAILCEQDQTDLKTQAPLRIERDRERRSHVMEVFQEGGFSDGVDYSMAALIFQHGENRYFMEKVTGSRKDRPELEKLLNYVRTGDTIVVWKLDRIGRSL